MDDAKLQIARIPLGPGEKMTADLYSHLRDKMWTVEIRNAFEEAK